MKKFDTPLFTLLCALACIGCQKAGSELADGIVTVINPNPQERHIDFQTFEANLEATYSTKTTVNLGVTHKVTWEKGDQVLVEDEDGRQAVYAAESGGSASTTLTRVSGDTLSTSGTYKAWYPVSWREGSLGDTVYYDDPSVLREGPMEAEGMRTLDFKLSCGIVIFSWNPSATVLAKQLVIAADEPLNAGSGTLTCDFTRKSPSGINIYPTGENTFPFFVPEGTYTSMNATFRSDGDDFSTITLEYDLSVTRGSIVEVDLNSPQGRITNLSRLEQANCYVISRAGAYSFAPTHGVSGIPVEEIESVDVLWETDNSPEQPAESIFQAIWIENGLVQFETPETFHTGNAVIAARDNAGDILWSWHIWAVETALGVQQYDSEGKVWLMDRSLGSLAAPIIRKPADNKYASLLYQWGRKDPFPGFCTQGDRSRMRPIGLQPSNANGPVSLETAIANPCVFYIGKSGWLDEADAPMWASETKSDQDPCPPGYRVPPVSAYNDKNGVFLPYFLGVTCISAYGAYMFWTDEGDYYGYPLSSCILGASGRRGNRSANYLWTGSRNDDGNAFSCTMTYGIPEGSTEKHPLITTEDPQPMSSGFAVRCMLIMND